MGNYSFCYSILKKKFAKNDGFDPNLYVERNASRFKYKDYDGNFKYTLIPSPCRPFDQIFKHSRFLKNHRQIISVFHKFALEDKQKMDLE